MVSGMPDKSLALILLSALLHAGWNLVLKTSRHKLAFNIFMHGSAIAVFSAWWIGARGFIPPPRGDVLVLTLGGGVFFSLYHMCLTAAYERADVSLAYPLTTTGPLYIPLWAYLFLGERLSLLGFAGIALAFFGAYILQMREISWVGLTLPLRNLRAPGVLLALSAGAFYSVGAVIDKRGVTAMDVFVFTYYLDVMLFLFLLASAFLSGGPIHFREELRARWPRALLAGFVLFASFITYRLGLRGAHVSYAVSVRQVSAVFGVLGGIVLFGERFGRVRLLGALFIAFGVALIRLG